MVGNIFRISNQRPVSSSTLAALHSKFPKPIFYISYSIYECVFLIWIMCPAADCILITGGNGVKRVLVTFSPTFTIVLWNMTLLQCFFLFIPEID